MIDLKHLFERWRKLEIILFDRFGKRPDLETILMLIGMQESKLIAKEFTKEEKQDLMHVGVCSVLASSGYYVVTHIDEDGWPHHKQIKALPTQNALDQEFFLKDHVLLYFQDLINEKNTHLETK